MLTCRQRTRKHFSQLPLWETSQDLHSGFQSSQMPTEARKYKAGGRVRLFPRVGATLTEQHQDRAPPGQRRQGISTYSQNSMTGEVAFCRDTWLWLVAFSFWNSTQFSIAETRQETQENYPPRGLDLGKPSGPMVQPGGFTQPPQVNMPQRALWGKSITYKQFKREAWLDSNRRRSFGGRVPPLPYSHEYGLYNSFLWPCS